MTKVQDEILNLVEHHTLLGGITDEYYCVYTNIRMVVRLPFYKWIFCLKIMFMFMAVQSGVVFTVHMTWFCSSFILVAQFGICNKWDILWFTVKEKCKGMNGNVMLVWLQNTTKVGIVFLLISFCFGIFQFSLFWAVNKCWRDINSAFKKYFWFSCKFCIEDLGSQQVSTHILPCQKFNFPPTLIIPMNMKHVLSSCALD